MPKKNILLTPGPTPVPAEVLQAMAEPMIHHRTPQYQEIFQDTLKGLRYVYQTKGDVLIFASSGTGSMDAAVSNLLSPGEKVLILEAGVFGERFTKIATAYGQEIERISVPYGQPMDTDKVLDTLKKQGSSIKAILCQLSDTSTAVRIEIEKIARAIAGTETLIVVDAISGLGVDPLCVDEWGIDLALGGSQKALMTPPGLSFVSVSEKAWKKIKQSKNPRFYFDFLLAKKCYDKNDTPFTPAISLVRAVGVALKQLQNEGLQACFARHEQMARAVRTGLQAMGIEIFTKEFQTAGLTAALFPEGIDGKKLLSRLKDEYGIWIAGGQGALNGKIMRIGHMGHIGKEDLEAGFVALETVLADMGFKSKKGSGRDALMEHWEGQGVTK